jgi:hypothetical protein
LYQPNNAPLWLDATGPPTLNTKSRRDFGHWCVRVANPVALARWVL